MKMVIFPGQKDTTYALNPANVSYVINGNSQNETYIYLNYGIGDHISMIFIPLPMNKVVSLLNEAL